MIILPRNGKNYLYQFHNCEYYFLHCKALLVNMIVILGVLFSVVPSGYVLPVKNFCSFIDTFWTNAWTNLSVTSLELKGENKKRIYAGLDLQHPSDVNPCIDFRLTCLIIVITEVKF